MEEITVVVLMSTRYLPVFKGHSSARRGPLCPSGCACRLLGHLVQKPLMRGIGALTAASSVGEKRVCRSSLRTEPGAGGGVPAGGLAQAVASPAPRARRCARECTWSAQLALERSMLREGWTPQRPVLRRRAEPRGAVAWVGTAVPPCGSPFP